MRRASAPDADPRTLSRDAPTEAPPASRGPGFPALRSRQFRLLWGGLLISNAGTWMASTAEGWLVTELDRERAPVWLGMIAVSFAIPMLILPPFGGALADRVARLRLLWIVQALYLLLAIVLAALTLTDRIAIWHLMAYAFLTGVILAFDSPCRHALLPDIVSREQLTSAVSLNSAAFTGAALVGPAIAGASIPLIGVGGVFVVNAASSVATLGALARMGPVSQGQRRATGEGVIASIARGVRFVRGSALLSGLLLVSIITGLFARSYQPLLAVFARDEFAVGSVAFGFLVAAPGLGTLVGALGLAGRGDVAAKGRLVVHFTLLFAALLLAFAATPWYAVALPLLVLVGFCGAVAAALVSTLIQLRAPGELRGRVMSLYLLTLVGVPSAGALLVGAAADLAGPRVAVGGGAALALLLSALVFTRNRAVAAAA